MATKAQLAARKLFAERSRAGTLKKKGVAKRKKNPAKKSAIPRVGISKAAKIARPSQITRKAPSPRLKARRQVAAKPGAPTGYFPNPLECWAVGFAKPRTFLASFAAKTTALEYAKAKATASGRQMYVEKA